MEKNYNRAPINQNFKVFGPVVDFRMLFAMSENSILNFKNCFISFQKLTG